MNREPRYHIANRAADLVAALRLGISAADDAGDLDAVKALLPLLTGQAARARSRCRGRSSRRRVMNTDYRDLAVARIAELETPVALASLASQINDAHRAATRTAQTALKHARCAGDLLIELKYRWGMGVAGLAGRALPDGLRPAGAALHADCAVAPGGDRAGPDRSVTRDGFTDSPGARPPR